MEQPSSNLFEGYRSVGHVTGPLPFIVRHGKNPQDTRILTIVGKTFHTYTTNLTLVEVSIPHEHDIKMIISDEKLVYTCSGRSILVWARGSKSLVHRLDGGHQADVKLITKLGSNRLVSVDEDNVLICWDVKEKELLTILSLDEDCFMVSTICHPMHYKDKVLLGSKQGQLQLFNVSTEKCLYKFNGWSEAVTTLVQSPIEDVVGIGLADGHIYVHNIKYDETVIKIYQEYGAITSMTFRLDSQPFLVTASEVGHLMVWNLEKKRLASQIRSAHVGKISKCQFLRNEALMVSSGSDNTLKVWSMDLPDGGGNLLCQRAGHSEPPSQIRFYGSKGFNLLSAGNDSTLKMFHMFSERLNRNLGTARMYPHRTKHKKSSEIRKLRPIASFAAETAREKNWDNIVACHKDSTYITTWNYDKCKMGEHFIDQPTFRAHEVVATNVCLTSCGNYIIVGYSNGIVFKYNMQSGIFRGTYESDQVSDHRAHKGSITGMTIDALNITLVTSGCDKKLRLWDFRTGSLLASKNFNEPISRLELHKENNLMAFIVGKGNIEIIDLETRNSVRKFVTDNSTVLDMVFSPDSRWLIVSYDDKSIKTWDLNLGKVVDSFRLSSPCTSLSMSSTGEFLATAHQDSLGINIWCNYSIYSPTNLRPIDPEAEPPLLDMPFVKCDEMAKEDEESENQAIPQVENESALEPIYLTPNQIHESLITLSTLASSRWKNILNIQEIREKQLIREEERRAKDLKVPFFIPVKDGLKPKLDKEALTELQEKGDTELQESRIQGLRLVSPIAKLLLNCSEEGDYGQFFNQLKELGPSATDAEIRSFGSDTCGDNRVMLCFLDAIKYGIRSNVDYELICSWLALFLKAHSDLIQTDSDVCRSCVKLLEPVKSSWNRLNEEFNQIFCVLNFVRSSIL